MTLERAHGRLCQTRITGARFLWWYFMARHLALSHHSKGHYIISEYADVFSKASPAMSRQVRFICAF